MCTIDKIKNSVCKYVNCCGLGSLVCFLKSIIDTGDEINVEIVEIVDEGFY